MTSMPDLLYGLRNICCTTFHKLEILLFPFLFFINCLCYKIIRWDVASNAAPAENIKHTFTWISDVHSKFLPYLLSMMQITCLLICLFLQNGYQKRTARVVPPCTYPGR